MKKENPYEKVVNYCCTRNPFQCLQIALFYVVFFTALGAFFYVCTLVHLHFLPLRHPKWQLTESAISTDPGLGYRPMPEVRKSPVPLRIRKDSTQIWVDRLEAFLQPYYNSPDLVDCAENESATIDKACSVPVPTSTSPCTAANRFGYSDGKPCILLKLNRIYGWRPRPYDEPPTELLDKLMDGYSRDNVYVTCTVQSKESAFNGTLEYYPSQAIPFRYYPFYNQKGYLSPFVFVRIGGMQRMVYYDVKCRGWAKNVAPDRFMRGSVMFKIRIED